MGEKGKTKTKTDSQPNQARTRDKNKGTAAGVGTAGSRAHRSRGCGTGLGRWIGVVWPHPVQPARFIAPRASLPPAPRRQRGHPPVHCKKEACSPLFDIDVFLWIFGPLLLFSDSSPPLYLGAPTTFPIRLFFVVAAGLDSTCLIIAFLLALLSWSLLVLFSHRRQTPANAQCEPRAPTSGSHHTDLASTLPFTILERRMYHPPVGVSNSHYWDRSPRGQQQTFSRGRFWKDLWGFRFFSNFPALLPGRYRRLLILATASIPTIASIIVGCRTNHTPTPQEQMKIPSGSSTSLV